MVNFPSVAWVPLVQPINSYHMVIIWFEGGRDGNDPHHHHHHAKYHMLTLRLRRR